MPSQEGGTSPAVQRVSVTWSDLPQPPRQRRAAAPPIEAPAGLVERVTFHNAETGFCVLRVKLRGQRNTVTVVGHAALISAGEFVSGSGVWVTTAPTGCSSRLPS